MPISPKTLAVRRLRQSDDAVEKAMWYLAEMAATFQPAHPDLAEELRQMIRMLEFIRALMVRFHKRSFGGRALHLMTGSDATAIIENAESFARPKQED